MKIKQFTECISPPIIRYLFLPVFIGFYLVIFWFDMPVIKVFSPERVTADQAQAMGADLEMLCVHVLRAQPSAIQILFVLTVMARGAPVLLEMHYRARPHRDATALAEFMQGAERSLIKYFGQTVRIRCFAENEADLSACN